MEMTSRFTKEPKHSYDKPINPNLDTMIKEWGPATLWILVQVYTQHRGAPLEDCESVKISNAEIRKESDHLTVFVDRHFSSSPEYQLSWETALAQYLDFCSLENIRHNRPHAVLVFLRDGSFGMY